jgi:hypothetical protein
MSDKIKVQHGGFSDSGYQVLYDISGGTWWQCGPEFKTEKAAQYLADRLADALTLDEQLAGEQPVAKTEWTIVPADDGFGMWAIELEGDRVGDTESDPFKEYRFGSAVAANVWIETFGQGFKDAQGR